MEFGGPVKDRVERALKEVRPALESDGGDVRLVRVSDGVVVVELLGACSGCAMAQRTLMDFVAERVLLYAPEISDVRRA